MIGIFPWLVLGFPLGAAVAIVLLALNRPRRAATYSLVAIGMAAALSCLLLAMGYEGEGSWAWLSVPNPNGGVWTIDFGWRVDGLSRLMLVVVSLVAGVIQVYSIGYMAGERGFGRFFAAMSLFAFSMLGIVLARDLVALFFFWELVGVSSYLLIGYWYERPAAGDAALKAILTNRVGDAGFLLGILLVWATAGTTEFGALQKQLQANPHLFGSWTTLLGILIFCGAAAKSAQFPLHVWLPDAIEGPIPANALIHAATMVAAGVYLLCRVFFLLDLPGSMALEVIGWIGALTCLLGAVLALQQDDIRRILAYSTISQLGYMVLAVGAAGQTGDPAPAMFHLTTHAFFNALLFLGAGAVLCAFHHQEQNIWRMGGLWKRLPWTYGTFLVAALALCGVPPFSGAASKELILASAVRSGHITWAWIGLVGVFLTTLYIGRLIVVVFWGQPRSDLAERPERVPMVMKGPMLALAVPCLLAGGWGWLHAYRSALGVRTAGGTYEVAGLQAVSLLLILIGIGVAWWVYGGAAEDPLRQWWPRFCSWLRQRLLIDAFYEQVIVRAMDGIATLVQGVDRWIVQGLLVRGAVESIDLAARILRLTHTGNLQTYALIIVVSTALVIALVVLR